MTNRILTIAAWACLVAIAAATLLPQGFRPHLGSQRIEHLLAFGLAGVLFGLAYPKRWWVVAAVVLGSAVLFEGLQLITPDRHGSLGDLAFKIAGGGAGLVAAALIGRLRRPT